MSFQDHVVNGAAVISDFTGSYRAPDARDFGAWKRMIDLAVAIPALFLFAPLMAVIAFWILLDSPGPVLFRQRRLGMGGEIFHILKFRTMTVLEDGEIVTQARENDTRITCVGHWLRKLSLDELPQLINVIKGEMSLVGPRPHAIAHDRYFATVIGNYELRQLVKPGITGWAQVNGFRGETPTVDAMRQRVNYDLWYATNSNIVLDLWILLRTPFVILQQKNAH